MDLNITKETVCINKLMYEGTAEQAIDSDITLPDYCPDILRILKCTIMPRVNSTQTTGDRITVDGSALIRTMYVDENGCVHCYEQNIPFSKYIEQSGMDRDPFVKVRVKCEYVNCRAVSPRRLDIHGSIAIFFKVVEKKDCEIMANVEGGGVQTKKSDVEVSDMIGSSSRMFTLSDVAEVGESKPPVGQILRTSANVSMNDIKVINNKAMIKGDLTVTTMYCSDNENSNPESIENSIPISQVVELAGLTDDCTTDVRLELMSIDIIPKADSSGEMRMLDMCAKICCDMSACKNKIIPEIVDSYSTDYEINTDYKTMEFKRLYDNVNETNLCKEKIDISDVNVKKVIDMWCTDVTSSTQQNNDEMITSGTVNVCMLIMDNDDQIGYFERQVNYQHMKNIGTKEKMEFDPCVTVCASNFVIGSNDSIDVRVELKIQVSIFAIETGRVLNDISVDEEKGLKKNKSALTIYFSASDENVWDIARKYNTTVEAIMKENSMVDEIIPEDSLLLIPGV